MYNHYMSQLKEECEAIWKNGRQLCESISLTGHPCINELHILLSEKTASRDQSDEEENIVTKKIVPSDLEDSEQDSSSERIRTGSKHERKRRFERQNSEERSRSNASSVGKRPPIKSHNSNIITIAASNCGEFQLERRVCQYIIDIKQSLYFHNFDLIF